MGYLFKLGYQVARSVERSHVLEVYLTLTNGLILSFLTKLNVRIRPSDYGISVLKETAAELMARKYDL
jgi:hypothetical protein